MARNAVRLNSREIQSYLDGDHGVEGLLDNAARRVAETIQSNAPVLSGAYRDSVSITTEKTDRMVKRVSVDVPYALKVEAANGVLARSIDAAG